MKSPASSRPSTAATRRRRTSSCRWSTTSCAGSPPSGWPTRNPARRSRPPPWSMTPTSGWAGRGAPAGTRPAPSSAGAAGALRRILVNRPGDKCRLKRGGGRERVDLDEVAIGPDGDRLDLLALDEALDALAREEPACAE